MSKPKSISKLKKQLDTLFSKYVRLHTADFDGTNTCFTCKRRLHYKELHAGHFMSRKHLATRWLYDEVNDLYNVLPQCPKCNLFDQGQQYLYGVYLDVKYGEGTAQAIQQMSKSSTKLTRADYEEKIKYYTEKLKELGY